eukprot:1600134-Rhodomonas_salina.2
MPREFRRALSCASRGLADAARVVLPQAPNSPSKPARPPPTPQPSNAPLQKGVPFTPDYFYDFLSAFSPTDPVRPGRGKVAHAVDARSAVAASGLRCGGSVRCCGGNRGCGGDSWVARDWMCACLPRCLARGLAVSLAASLSSLALTLARAAPGETGGRAGVSDVRSEPDQRRAARRHGGRGRWPPWSALLLPMPPPDAARCRPLPLAGCALCQLEARR